MCHIPISGKEADRETNKNKHKQQQENLRGGGEGCILTLFWRFQPVLAVPTSVSLWFEHLNIVMVGNHHGTAKVPNSRLPG